MSGLAIQDEPVDRLFFLRDHLFCSKGRIDSIECNDDTDAESARCRAKRVSILTVPTHRIKRAPSPILISRKFPFHEREREWATEAAHHAGVWCEFYRNSRGRFMRLTDSYKHVTYALQRAVFDPLPFDYPDRNPDLDIGWHPE